MFTRVERAQKWEMLVLAAVDRNSRTDPPTQPQTIAAILIIACNANQQSKEK